MCCIGITSTEASGSISTDHEGSGTSHYQAGCKLFIKGTILDIITLLYRLPVTTNACGPVRVTC